MAPDTGLTFQANYRVGGGGDGNIGRDTLAHVVLPSGWLYPTTDIAAVRNPLPATGGIDPEDMQHIAQFAPFAYESAGALRHRSRLRSDGRPVRRHLWGERHAALDGEPVYGVSLDRTDGAHRPPSAD